MHTQTHNIIHTVDGRNPAPVDMVNIPLFTGFHTPQVVVWDFFHQKYVTLPKTCRLPSSYISPDSPSLRPIVPASRERDHQSLNQSLGFVKKSVIDWVVPPAQDVCNRYFSGSGEKHKSKANAR